MGKRAIDAIAVDKERAKSVPEKDFDNVSKEQKNIRYGQDTEERKLLSHWVMCVVSIWLFLVLLAIVFNELWHLGINQTVSVVLLGTTTINILGLAFIVLRGLFPDSKKD